MFISQQTNPWSMANLVQDKPQQILVCNIQFILQILRLITYTSFLNIHAYLRGCQGDKC